MAINRVVLRETAVSAKAGFNGGLLRAALQAIDYIAGDDTVWEREPVEARGQRTAS